MSELGKPPLGIEARVARLEAVAAKWRAIAVGVAMIAMVGFIAGGSPKEPDTLEGKNVVFRDKAGNVRMELGAVKTSHGDVFGLVFKDPTGDEICSLHQTAAGGAGLVFEESAAKRKQTAQSALAFMQQHSDVTHVDDEFVRTRTAEIAAIGPCHCLVGSLGLLLIDESPGAGVTKVATDEARFASVLVGCHQNEDPSVAGVEKNCVRVLGGKIDVHDRTTKQDAVLGSNELVDKRTGAVTKLPVSSLTFTDKDGNVLMQIPR